MRDIEQHRVDDTGAPPRFDTRVVILLADDLLAWQELNVTAFLAGAITASEDGLVGGRYQDADGNEYLPMLRQPVMILTAPPQLLLSVRERSVGRGLAVAIYTRELFTTTHDTANRAAVAAKSAA